MTPLPREICPACGRSVAVRRGGELREHRPARDIELVCSASGMTVDAAGLRLGELKKYEVDEKGSSPAGRAWEPES